MKLIIQEDRFTKTMGPRHITREYSLFTSILSHYICKALFTAFLSASTSFMGFKRKLTQHIKMQKTQYEEVEYTSEQVSDMGVIRPEILKNYD